MKTNHDVIISRIIEMNDLCEEYLFNLEPNWEWSDNLYFINYNYCEDNGDGSRFLHQIPLITDGEITHRLGVEAMFMRFTFQKIDSPSEELLKVIEKEFF